MDGAINAEETVETVQNYARIISGLDWKTALTALGILESRHGKGTFLISDDLSVFGEAQGAAKEPGDEQTAEIQMPNPWQLAQIRKVMPELARQLRAALHNDRLHIQLVQAEFTQEQMAFTAEEKYKLMVEQNPALAQLKERLDLSID